jgi:hypothetical protein
MIGMVDFKQNGRAKPIIYGIRKQWDEPRFRENFEILAKRGHDWLEKHPPKVSGE